MSVKRSLRTQLIFQYMVIVIVCMLIIPTAISELLDMQFRNFASERLRENESEIAELFAALYVQSGSWDICALLPMDADFLRWPMVTVQLTDEDGDEVRTYSRMSKREKRRGKSKENEPEILKEELIVSNRDILIDGRRVGGLRFLCVPFNFSPEGAFLRKFNRIMYYAVAFMLVTAGAIAFFMAVRISRPVLNAAKRAQQISRGNYQIEDKMESDITELSILIDSVDRLGSTLEAQEKLRRRLLSDVAHELRNPVTIIKSHLEAIEDGVWQPTPERIRLTVSEVDRLSQLIKEVERLTSIESAGHALALEKADVSQIIEKAALVFDPLYKNKGVTLKREVEAGVAAVVDAGKIRQAIENLLSNALRYTDAGGEVSVTMKKEGGDFTVEVRDSGIGISDKDLPYIFERFYRTDVSRARASGGLGIGLAIVKAIIDAHGGTISVKSKAGEGSRFTLKVPRRDIE